MREGLVRQSSGCKVGWEFYDTLENARARIASAEAEAVEQAKRGYDFGYCVPGELMQMHDGTWRITVP